jgi:hypothetical protein
MGVHVTTLSSSSGSKRKPRKQRSLGVWKPEKDSGKK